MIGLVVPRVRGGGVGAQRLRVPGAYEVALRWVCERETEPDPRGFLWVDTDEDRRRWDRSVADGLDAADGLFGERLAVGEPLVVPASMVGGRSIPLPRNHPLNRVKAKAYVVHLDDSVATLENNDLPP